MIVVAHRVVITGAAHCGDRYLRDAEGRWRIVHAGCERLREATIRLTTRPVSA